MKNKGFDVASALHFVIELEWRMRGRVWNVAGALSLSFFSAMCVGCSGGTQPTVVADGQSSSQQLPFTDSKPLVVPADTMIYVRMQRALTSASAKAGQSFTAVLDEPLLAEDQTVAQAGTELTGTVVAARDSGRVNTAGYVRVVISSITVNGKTVPMQTASVIAGGANIRNHNLSFVMGRTNSFQDTGRKTQAGFAAGQRLAFRLTQPLSFDLNERQQEH